ncbi:hypothetical protein [[Pseudomonas] boreopolis]
MNARSRPDTSRRYSLAPAGRWGLVLWLWLPLLAAAGAVAYAAQHDRTWLHAGMLLAIAIAGSLAFLRRGIDLQGWNSRSARPCSPSVWRSRPCGSTPHASSIWPSAPISSQA